MLRSRIIPCLLVHNNGLIKTIQFKNPKYVGDPINAVKIFNEKEVDELIVLDVDKSRNGDKPNFDLIRKLADESRMPLCYGGGINNVEDAVKIIELGVEKIAISNAAIENPKICKELGEIIGNQSVVVVLDVKKKPFSNNYNIFTLNGSKKEKISLKEALEVFSNLEVGEIVINSIDNDGKMEGYDERLIEFCRENTNLPLTFLGGAGSILDIKNLISKYKIIGAAAGSLFVFKGIYKAVLINYPNKIERKPLYK